MLQLFNSILAQGVTVAKTQDKTEKIPVEKRALIQATDTIETAKTAVTQWFTELRRIGQLKTSTEFANATKSALAAKVANATKSALAAKVANATKAEADQFFQKPDLGRLLGKSFIEKAIKDNDLKLIKVPEKTVVINTDIVNRAQVQIHGHVGIYFPQLQTLNSDCNTVSQTKNNALSVYSRGVKACNRKITNSEALELITLCEQVGYWDINSDNFIVAEDSVYIIDTEFRNFSPVPPYQQLERLIKFGKIENPEWFRKELVKRRSAFQQRNPTVNLSYGAHAVKLEYLNNGNKPFDIYFDKFFQ
jgi:hypothetical protein